jgi:hypothetical protein
MPRLPTIPFERPMPDPDDLEESGLSSDHSAPQGHIKLGGRWRAFSLSYIPRSRNFLERLQCWV